MPAYTNYKDYTQFKKCCKPIGLQGPQGPAGPVAAPVPYTTRCAVTCTDASQNYYFLELSSLTSQGQNLVLWNPAEQRFSYLIYS